MLKRFTDFILQGRFPAMGTAFVCAFIPFVSTVSVLIAAFVTLRKGIQEGALVFFAATLPALIWYFGFPVDQDAGGLTRFDVFIIILGSNLLTWLFAILLRYYSSWSIVLQSAALLCIVFVGAVHFYNPDIQAWWQTWITDYFTSAMQSMGEGKPEDAGQGVSAITNIVSGIKPYATGFVAIMLASNALLQVVLARWWQSAIFYPGGLRQELRSIRMSYAASAVFLVGLVLSYWGNDVVVDIMPILYLTFCLAGLSLVHCIFAPMKSGWLWLGLIYLNMTLFPVSVTLVAMFALLDTGLDFRKRLIKQV